MLFYIGDEFNSGYNRCMCGIAGIISMKEELTTDDLPVIRSMLHLISHRGPDQSGHIFHPSVLLGNQRLRMQDLTTAGDLPMVDDEAGVALAFNGEISNFKELIEKYQLRQKYSFQSNSDTEVFLKLYLELGISFLSELSGMFAFILHDRKSDRVYFGRDFFGINPLFFSQSGNKIIIASEIKALVPFMGELPALNVQAFYDLFTLGYIPGESSPYQDVEEVGPGTFFEFSPSEGLKKKRYFRFRWKESQWSEKEAILATREALVDSVRRNLTSDSPVGIMCSGGVDTGSLVGISHALGKSSNLHTFGISISDPNFDESAYQKIIADYAGTKHHQINVGLPDILEHFEDHIAFMDEPYGHGAALPTYLLAKEAQKHVRGLLSGEGGDELFNAYETHGAHHWKNHYRKFPAPIRSVISGFANALPVAHGKLSFDFKLKRFTEGAELPLHESHLFWRHLIKDDVKRDLFREKCEPTSRISRDLFHTYPGLDDFSKLSSWDLEHFFFGDLMVKNDRMCFAHSVESRFPYMDRAVTDLVMSMPASFRIKRGRRRHLQKEAMKPFLPKEIYQRDGFGLELPYNKWFLGSLSPLYGKYFQRGFIERLGFIHWETFELIFRFHREKKIDAGRFLWGMLILCTWYDLNHVSKTAESLRQKVREDNRRVRVR